MKIFLFLFLTTVLYSTDYSEIYSKKAPSSVHFYYRLTNKDISKSSTRRKKAHSKNYFKNREFIEASLGSGFIIDKSGLFITNNHVVSKANQMRVRLNSGNNYKVDLIMANADRDLALLKINDRNWFGELSDQNVVQLIPATTLKVGDPIFTIGNYGGNFNSLNVGHVCGLNRSTFVIGDGFENLIQVDNSLNKGNSGGALFNAEGLVVGVIIARSSLMDNVGYAIPSQVVIKFLDDYRRFKRPTYNLLGIEGQYITMEKAQKLGLKSVYGVLVKKVFKRTPAYSVLQHNDVIIEVNEDYIKDPSMLRGVLQGCLNQTKYFMKVIRKNKTVTIQTQLQDIKSYPNLKKLLFVEKNEIF